jgi:polysaccharide biosynthesis protein PslH
LWTGWIGLEHATRAVVNVHFLFSIDLECERPEGLMGRLLWWRTVAAERALLRKYPHVITLSPRLTCRVRELTSRSSVTTVPLGIDHALYSYIPDAGRSTEPVVSVIGSMNWSPTYTAAIRALTRLWPQIKKQVPEAKLQLVGWGARTALKDFLDLPDVSVEENVPDTRQYFERTSVLLYAPARGSGMKVKILEALAYGVPVVTTADGVEGLPAVDGVHAGVCEDDAGLIERTLSLLTDTNKQNQQREAGRALLEAHCGPSPTVAAVEHMYMKIIDNQQGARIVQVGHSDNPSARIEQDHQKV